MKVLWISRCGYQCSYSYVTLTLVKAYLEKYPDADISLFCIGIVNTLENIEKISQTVHIPLNKIYYINEPLQNSTNPEDQEYFNDYFAGIYHLNNVVDLSKPDIIISLDDPPTINHQMNMLKDRLDKIKFVPYLTIDCSDLPDTLLKYKFDSIITMTNFGANQLRDKFAKKVFILEHIVDPKIWYPMDTCEVRNKWNISTLCSDSPHSVAVPNTFVIAGINANNDRKRWDLLITAFARFAQKHMVPSLNSNNKQKKPVLLIRVSNTKPRSNVHGLTICGEYDFEKLIENACTTYNLDKSSFILIPGEFTVEQLNEIYNCANIGLTTTSGEGWGLIPCEMSLCNIPQIVPDYSSFSEIFPESAGLIPTTKYPVKIGRYSDKHSETLSNAYLCILKSYISSTPKNDEVCEIGITKGIPTIIISENGIDELLKCNNFLSIDVDLIGHFKTMTYTSTFLKTLHKYPERLQVLISMDISFLDKCTNHYSRLKECLPDTRHNLYMSSNELARYHTFKYGSVAIPKIDDVVIRLEAFYQSERLRKINADYCRSRILKLCNKERIVDKLYKILEEV